jgi:hypothetical protein
MTEMTSVGTDTLDCLCEACLEEYEHHGHS